MDRLARSRRRVHPRRLPARRPQADALGGAGTVSAPWTGRGAGLIGVPGDEGFLSPLGTAHLVEKKRHIFLSSSIHPGARTSTTSTRAPDPRQRRARGGRERRSRSHLRAQFGTPSCTSTRSGIALFEGSGSTLRLLLPDEVSNRIPALSCWMKRTSELARHGGIYRSSSFWRQVRTPDPGLGP